LESLSLAVLFAPVTANVSLTQQDPGDVIHDKVKEVLSDGIVTKEERDHLITLLHDLIGAPETDLAAAARVTELAYDSVDRIDFPDKYFLLTGEFVHGPRNHCESEIRERGGLVSKAVNKKLNYLIIGSLGSVEWKHGSFGTKIEKAMQYKREKIPILVVQETIWREAVKRL
jgi:NAD-dependent DNA ligase